MTVSLKQTCHFELRPVAFYHFVRWRESYQPAKVKARIILLQVQKLHLNHRRVVDEVVFCCLDVFLIPLKPSNFQGLGAIGRFVPVQVIIQCMEVSPGNVAEEGGGLPFASA